MKNNYLKMKIFRPTDIHLWNRVYFLRGDRCPQVRYFLYLSEKWQLTLDLYRYYNLDLHTHYSPIWQILFFSLIFSLLMFLCDRKFEQRLFQYQEFDNLCLIDKMPSISQARCWKAREWLWKADDGWMVKPDYLLNKDYKSLSEKFIVRFIRSWQGVMT